MMSEGNDIVEDIVENNGPYENLKDEQIASTFVPPDASYYKSENSLTPTPFIHKNSDLLMHIGEVEYKHERKKKRKQRETAFENLTEIPPSSQAQLTELNQAYTPYQNESPSPENQINVRDSLQILKNAFDEENKEREEVEERN